MRSDRVSVMWSADGTTGRAAVEEEKGSKALMVAVTSGVARGYVSKRSACARESSGEGEGASGTVAQTDKEDCDP